MNYSYDNRDLIKRGFLLIKAARFIISVKIQARILTVSCHFYNVIFLSLQCSIYCTTTDIVTFMILWNSQHAHSLKIHAAWWLGDQHARLTPAELRVSIPPLLCAWLRFLLKVCVFFLWLCWIPLTVQKHAAWQTGISKCPVMERHPARGYSRYKRPARGYSLYNPTLDNYTRGLYKNIYNIWIHKL